MMVLVSCACLKRDPSSDTLIDKTENIREKKWRVKFGAMVSLPLSPIGTW